MEWLEIANMDKNRTSNEYFDLYLIKLIKDASIIKNGINTNSKLSRKIF